MAFKTMTLRGWATPLTIGAFLLMAGTGAVLFFKFDMGLMAPVHRLCSWIFLVGATGHILANIRSVKTHLTSTLGRLSAFIFLTLLTTSMFSWGRTTSPKRIELIETALIEAPVSSLAMVKQTSPDALIATFRDAGITATPDQSLHAIATANHTNEDRLLGIVFGSNRISQGRAPGPTRKNFGTDLPVAHSP